MEDATVPWQGRQARHETARLSAAGAEAEVPHRPPAAPRRQPPRGDRPQAVPRQLVRPKSLRALPLPQIHEPRGPCRREKMAGRKENPKNTESWPEISKDKGLGKDAPGTCSAGQGRSDPEPFGSSTRSFQTRRLFSPPVFFHYISASLSSKAALKLSICLRSQPGSKKQKKKKTRPKRLPLPQTPPQPAPGGRCETRAGR